MVDTIKKGIDFCRAAGYRADRAQGSSSRFSHDLFGVGDLMILTGAKIVLGQTYHKSASEIDHKRGVDRDTMEHFFHLDGEIWFMRYMGKTKQFRLSYFVITKYRTMHFWDNGSKNKLWLFSNGFQAVADNRRANYISDINKELIAR